MLIPAALKAWRNDILEVGRKLGATDKAWSWLAVADDDDGLDNRHNGAGLCYADIYVSSLNIPSYK
jgi:hypothetical protein